MTQRLSDPAINPQPGSHSVYVNLGKSVMYTTLFIIVDCLSSFVDFKLCTISFVNPQRQFVVIAKFFTRNYNLTNTVKGTIINFLLFGIS